MSEHELFRCVGRGACGDVWLARSVMGAWRAVKVVWRDRFEHPRIYEREFEGLKKFEPVSRTHEGLVDILQVGRHDAAGCFYYVMELADDAASGRSSYVSAGGALSSSASSGNGSLLPETYVPLTLARYAEHRKRVPVRECARLGAEIAAALTCLHEQGLVHRDVKPSNIIFVDGRPKLADIGLVTGVGEARSFVGTNGYIPPEGPGGSAADVFSLGKVLYELATGKSRFDFPDLPRELVASTPDSEFAELNEIILRACAPEAGQRQASAAELRGELLLVDAGRSVRRLRRNERLVARWRRMGMVAGLLGIVALAAIVFQRHQNELAGQRAAHEARQRRLIEEKERITRHNLYAADMNLAQQALDAGNFGRAEELLTAHQPSAEAEDLRGFEWFHYRHLVRGDSAEILRGHEQLVSALALSRDGRHLFSAGFDGTIREWSVPEWKETRRWARPGAQFLDLALSPAGDQLAVEDGQHNIFGLLDLAAGTWTTRVSPAAPAVQFAPDGRELARGLGLFLFETNAVVEIIDSTLQPRRILPESGGRAWFSPNGRLLVTGSWGHALKLWSWPALEFLGELPDAGVILSAAFSPDGTRLATAARDGRLQLWDLAGRRKTREVRTHRNEAIWSIVFSPDGTWLASAGNDQTVRVWEIGDLAERRVFRGHGSEVWSVLWTADGRQLISAGKDTTIRVWDFMTEAAPLEIANLDQPPAFSPDEKLLAVHQRDHSIRVIDLATRRMLRSFDGVELGGFAAEGRELLLLRDHATFERRSLVDGQLLEARPLAIPDHRVSRRRLSPGGRWIAWGLEDGWVWAQNLAEPAPPRELAGHAQMITVLKFSPDERRLFTGSLDRTGRVWDLEAGREWKRFDGHQMAVASAVLMGANPDLADSSLPVTAMDRAAAAPIRPTSMPRVAAATMARGRGVLREQRMAAPC